MVKVSREAFRAKFVVVEARAREVRRNGCLVPLGIGDREANHVIWYRLGLHNPKCESVSIVEA